MIILQSESANEPRLVLARAPATGCQIPLPFRCRPRFTATESAASDPTKFRLIPLIDNEF